MSGLEYINNAITINICMYAVLKYIFRKSKIINSISRNVLINVIISTICMVLSFIVLMLLYIVLIPFFLYKSLITLLLHIKHGKDFGGMLRSADNMWIIENKNARNIVNFLFIVQFDKNKRNLIEFAKALCEQRFLKTDRLSSIRMQYMGYSYFLKNQLIASDVVKEMKFSKHSVCDKKSLQLFLQEYCNQPLPMNDTATWEMVVGQEPLKLSDSMQEEQYPLILRAHHTVADGATGFSFFIKDMSDEGATILRKPRPSHTTGHKKFGMEFRSKLQKFCVELLKGLKAHAHVITMLEPIDKNLIHGPNLSGEKRLGFYVEKTPECLNAVKKVKNKFPGSTFMDVILTGISASLFDYFRENTTTIPENIVLTFMAMADRKALRFDQKELKNTLSMGSVRLPINGDNDKPTKSTILDRFIKTMYEYKLANNSHDILIYHWLLKLVGDIIPIWMVKRIVKSNEVISVTLSNMPGFQKIHIDGQQVNHMLFWIPNYYKTGIGFSLVTYDNRFQMGLLVDKVLIPDEAEVQKIVENTFKYIVALTEETDKPNLINNF